MMSKAHAAIGALGAAVAAALLIQGCAPPFPKEDRDKVDRKVTFRELKADPDRYKGKWLMLSGVIVAAKNMKEGTTLEVLQKPADDQGRPYETDETGGRFLVESDKFLDTAVYYPGRELAVIAEVAGQRTLPVDQIQYQYPVLTAKAIHLWRPSGGPHFFFGVGVSSTFH